MHFLWFLRYRNTNKFGKPKVGIREGFICRIPPPGGVGTFVSDVLCQSYVVRVTGNWKSNKACASKGEFVELPSAKLILGFSHALKQLTIAHDRRKGKLSRRFVANLQHMVRFSYNPISCALACSFACRDGHTTAGTTTMQKAELLLLAKEFAGIAHNLVAHTDHRVIGAVLLPGSRAEQNLFPKHAQEESALELALANAHTSFTRHPVCEDFVANMWSGGWSEVRNGLHLPDTDDLWNLSKMGYSVTKNVTLLNSCDFVLSPIVRFVTSFVLFSSLVAVHHMVVFEEATLLATAALTTTEVVFIVMAIGHMLSEAEEVYEAMRGNRLWKYVTDGWNILDWSVHIIVIAYAYLRAAGIQNKSASECQFAVRILSLNCILLWFRLVNVMTISPQLGPLVHMIALMGKDVAIFLVLLFMCTC